MSLRELERAVAILEREIIGHRVQAIVQPDDETLALTLYGGGSKPSAGRRRHLLLCCGPESARLSSPALMPRAPASPPRFAQYLRAHVGNASVEGLSLLDADRQALLQLRAREGRFDLLLAIFGRRSNVYLLDERGCIAVSLRRLAETRSELRIGDPWRSPASTPPRAGEDRFTDVSDEEFFEAVEGAYASARREQGQASLARRIEQALRREARTLDRKLEKLSGELAKAQQDVGLERRGELLKGALDRVGRGDAEVAVRDWETGEDVTIPLDPTKSPAENLAWIFKRYQKAVRALTRGGAQQDRVQTAREEIRALDRDLRALQGEEGEGAASAIEAFAERDEVRRLLAKYAPSPPPARTDRPREQTLAGRKLPAKYVPRRYRTAGGLEVWVGRSDAANDYLTTRLARGKDLFFHLDGAPGSHVILRTEGRADPPSDAILDACELAVHYSKQKKASRADVHVVPIKNVRKPKGAKPGLVMVHGGRSVHLRRDPARLERILNARIEE
jgi:predicted ribosome quality control (RQC) complex YloA/Tae2 family protein